MQKEPQLRSPKTGVRTTERHPGRIPAMDDGREPGEHELTNGGVLKRLGQTCQAPLNQRRALAAV